MAKHQHRSETPCGFHVDTMWFTCYRFSSFPYYSSLKACNFLKNGPIFNPLKVWKALSTLLWLQYVVSTLPWLQPFDGDSMVSTLLWLPCMVTTLLWFPPSCGYTMISTLPWLPCILLMQSFKISSFWEFILVYCDKLTLLQILALALNTC